MSTGLRTETPPEAPPRSWTTSPWRPGPPLLGLFAGWLALCSWSGMVAEPTEFLVPTLFVGLVIALVGSGLRVLDVPSYGVAVVQVLVALLSLNTLFAAGQSFLGVIPTEASVRRVVFVINNGGATLNTYAAPVEVNPTHTAALLMACGLGVLLSIDILAMGLRRPPLIALPLLVTLSVPVSILRDGLAFPVFIGVALLFLRLLASENLDRFKRWGERARGDGRVSPAGRPTTSPVQASLWKVAIAAVLVALVVAPLVPVSDLLDRDDGAGTGDGTGGRFELTSENPMIRLRRDLLLKTHTPLLYARTNASSTAYLRTAVLDQFTSDAWRPSVRDLPEENDADGTFPNPPGLAAGIAAEDSEWTFRLAPGFSTRWLPLPYPIRRLEVPGVWRYDARTLDVAYVGGGRSSDLTYAATAFTPEITADLLDSTVRAPESVRDPYTKVPKDLPDVIRERAREVTADADNDFEKAVALQDWFREGGDFRYSLEQRPGSGMDLLASFVTDDRVGYCEQFAAAMAAMGRALKIPSRVVVGFLDGELQQDGRILYTSDARHAWPEMYFSGVGWVRFEPTPSQRAGSTPSWTRESADAAAPSAGPSAGASQAPAATPEESATDVAADDGQGLSIPRWPLALLVLVLLVGLAPGLVRRVQRRRRLADNDPVHLAEGAWAELRATALDLGLTWPEQRSPREQARSVAGQVEARDEDLVALEDLLVRVERGRYGRGRVDVDADVDGELSAGTRDTVGAWRKVMEASVDRKRGWRSRVWPLSLLRGPQD